MLTYNITDVPNTPDSATRGGSTEYVLAQVERRALERLRDLAQDQLSRIPGLTAAALDPGEMVTDTFVSEFVELAVDLWSGLGTIAVSLGLAQEGDEDGYFAGLIKDAINDSAESWIDTIKTLIERSAEDNYDILGEFFFAPDYIPGTGLKPPSSYMVQFGDIRDVLGRLGGYSPEGDAQLSTGITGGNLFHNVLADAGVDTDTKLWMYGETVRRTFNGHLQMDGLVFTEWDDPALEIAPQDYWLRTTHYRPGDHWGCACVVVPYVPNLGEAFTRNIEATVASAETIEFACTDASCAPPPVGTGGSVKGMYVPGNPWGYDGELPPFKARNGAEYTFRHGGRRSLDVYRNGKMVGFINWFKPDADNPNPKVHRIQVHGSHRRKGVATALWERARMIEPNLQHSHALLDDGKAWIEGMNKKAETASAEVIEFACHDASCRPPTSGGTGGSSRRTGYGMKIATADDLRRAGASPESIAHAETMDKRIAETKAKRAADKETAWQAHRARLTSLAQETIDRVYGNGIDSLFRHGAETTTVPFPTAPRRKGERPFDQDLVNRELAKPPVLEAVDPRLLHATQPGVVRTHVDYYLSGEYERSSRTAADNDRDTNRYPIVYVKKTGEHIILAGHHRATAALLSGTNLQARVIREPS